MSIKIKIKIVIKKCISISAPILLTLFLTSCKKFVVVEPPTTSLVTISVFDKNSTATAAQLAIYAQMQDFPYNINQLTGLSSDELKNYGANLSLVNIYKNTINATNDATKIGIWKSAYTLIYQVNAILEALPNSPGVTKAVKQQLIGESKFVRGFLNFYLINLYGDAPLILSTDYITNSQQVRAPTTNVYQQIIADLVDAQNLLNTNYVDATDTVTTTDKIRPNKWSATALLSRVYLYTGQWEKAESQASSIINNTVYGLLPNLDSVFLKNSKEAIWQLQPNSSNKYTSEGSGFTITRDPTGSGTVYASAISDQLFNTFDSTDKRKSKWIGSYKSGSNTWYFPTKYKATTTSTSVTEYSMVLRLSEQYLIRAEAKAQQGILTGANSAVTDLNNIRNRAGIGDYKGTVDKTSILSAIMRERQAELFTEGHRWLDLKRSNIIDSLMPIISVQKSSKWDTNQQLYPIPVTDIQNSVGVIIQNPGY